MQSASGNIIYSFGAIQGGFKNLTWVLQIILFL